MAVPAFIFISGHNYTMSFERQSSLQEYYQNNMPGKILRYTIPAIITFALYSYIFEWQPLNICIHLLNFFYGQYGLGAYYINIMIQFALLYPFLYFCVKKWKEIGVAIIAFINLFFELSCVANNLDYSVYRVLIFRYLFIIGIIYLLLPNHLGYSYRIFNNWSNPSIIVGFYIFLPPYYIINEINCAILPSNVTNILSLIARTSYHITYTQMIFFSIKDRLHFILFCLNELGSSFDTLFAIGISVIFGIIFYKVDLLFFKKLYLK